MQIVENLYIAFADIPKPSAIEGCPVGCCMLREYRLDLVKGHLRETDPELLWEYINEGLYTVGTDLDFQYFIPKILELCLHDIGPIYSPPSLMEKLEIAGFNEWSLTKKVAIESAIFEIVHQGVKANFINFDFWLCGICRLDVNIQSFIDLLDCDYAEASRKYFIRCHYPESWEGPRMKGALWDDLPPEKTQIVHNWLVSQPPV